eukprot:6207162-Pleurochrysis_carterae.AAC.2
MNKAWCWRGSGSRLVSTYQIRPRRLASPSKSPSCLPHLRMHVIPNRSAASCSAPSGCMPPQRACAFRQRAFEQNICVEGACLYDETQASTQPYPATSRSAVRRGEQRVERGVRSLAAVVEAAKTRGGGNGCGGGGVLPYTRADAKAAASA